VASTALSASARARTAADSFDATEAADNATVSDYAALVLPGGVANPDFLRTVPAAVDFVTGG